MTCSWDEAYNTFPVKNNISLTSFYKYKSREFCKPKRISDKCHYCMEYHVLNCQLKKFYRDRIIFEDDQKEIIIDNIDSGDEKELIDDEKHDDEHKDYIPINESLQTLSLSKLNDIIDYINDDAWF